MTDEVSEERAALIRSAASAVLTLTQGRETCAPAPDWVSAEWWYAPASEIEAALNFEERVPFKERLYLSFMYAERCALEADEDADSGALASALHSLVDAVWYAAAFDATPQQGKNAAALATSRLLEARRHRRSKLIRAGISRMAPAEDDRAHLGLVLGVSWTDFEDCLKRIRRVISADAEVVLPEAPVRSTLSIADVIISERPGLETITPPDYDCSDQERRVAVVELTGFRGSPVPLTLDLLKNARPVSAVILGDNGSGKSTLADAIEFALQGRLGRSVAFESPLAPAALSFAADFLPEVAVTLEDSSTVRRALLRREDGKLSVDTDDVRPGFRLAPVSLKRHDILRFLDTDAMARGHVFFDYFPASANEMAVRPEEQLQRLDDEEYELRVQRTHLSEVLAAHLEADAELLANRSDLQRILREQVLEGEKLEEAYRSGRWQLVPEEIRTTSEQLLGAMTRLSGIKKQRQRGIETKNPIRYKTQAALLAHALDGIGDLLTDAFREITGAEHVERIDVVFGRSGPVALDVVVELSSGTRCFPQQLFSEGYRDLLAILFFVVVAKRAAERGQARVLILDDVFQSVDAGIRSGTVDYLLREFKDWQLIFTVHDRLWFEQLQGSFRRHNHQFVERELRRWRFRDGIALVTTPASLTTNLEHQLQHGDPSGICGAAGFLLEQASDQLSQRLGTSVKRTYGDKYTLGALWPGVAKECRKTSLRAVCDRVDALFGLRNLAGAHYNEWAQSLSLDEAHRFGEAVLDFVRGVWCPECHDWVTKSGQNIRCRGGHVTL